MTQIIKCTALTLIFFTLGLKVYVLYFAPIHDRLDLFVNGIYTDALMVTLIAALVVGGLGLLIKNIRIKNAVLIFALVFFLVVTIVVIRNIFFPNMDLPLEA